LKLPHPLNLEGKSGKFKSQLAFLWQSAKTFDSSLTNQICVALAATQTPGNTDQVSSFT
jgi:hypothetical protein